MPDLAHLLSLRRNSAALLGAAESAWDSFAGWGDWKQKNTADGPRMVSPSGKRSLTLEAFQKLAGKSREKIQGDYEKRTASGGVTGRLKTQRKTYELARASGQLKDVIESAAPAKGGAEKVKSAPKAKPSATTPKGQPKPGEAERIATATARVARDSYERALKADPASPELGALKRRAEVAEAAAKTPRTPVAGLSVASLPKLPEAKSEIAPKPKGDFDSLARGAVEMGVQTAIRDGQPIPDYVRRAYPEIVAKYEKKPARKPVGTPKNPIADPNPVLRRSPTLVNGNPIVAANGQNRAGIASAKLRSRALAKVKPIPPRPDGSPDVKALKEQVDAGILTGASMGWAYDFKAAKAALSVANGQIDDYARKSPQKIEALAREVTGEKPRNAEDAVVFLKAWVAETLDLLEQKPATRKGGRVTGMSERAAVSWFAEAGRRVGMVRVLFAALAA